MENDCLRCGNCCPDICEYKKKEDDGLFTCTIHPSTGNNRDEIMSLCNLPPIRYFLIGIACKKILIELGKNFDTQETVKSLNGQVILKNV
jgi:hypothetical protein